MALLSIISSISSLAIDYNPQIYENPHGFCHLAVNRMQLDIGVAQHLQLKAWFSVTSSRPTIRGDLIFRTFSEPETNTYEFTQHRSGTAQNHHALC